jgi:hypothetical protein
LPRDPRLPALSALDPLLSALSALISALTSALISALVLVGFLRETQVRLSAAPQQKSRVMSDPPMAPIFNVRRHSGAAYENGAVHRARGVNDAMPDVEVVDGREEESGCWSRSSHPEERRSAVSWRPARQRRRRQKRWRWTRHSEPSNGHERTRDDVSVRPGQRGGVRGAQVPTWIHSLYLSIKGGNRVLLATVSNCLEQCSSPNC